MNPCVLGVDPGVVSGWALIGRSGAPVDWGQAGARGRPLTGRDVYEVLKRIGPKVGPAWPPLLAIEGQFILGGGGKGGEFHGQSLATLKTARAAGIWIGVCGRYGIPVWEHGGEPAIQPQTWRSAVWGRKKWTSAQSKEHAVKMAAARWQIRIKKTHHHTAEAMWIGAYVWGELVARNQQPGLGLR